MKARHLMSKIPSLPKLSGAQGLRLDTQNTACSWSRSCRPQRSLGSKFLRSPGRPQRNQQLHTHLGQVSSAPQKTVTLAEQHAHGAICKIGKQEPYNPRPALTLCWAWDIERCHGPHPQEAPSLGGKWTDTQREGLPVYAENPKCPANGLTYWSGWWWWCQRGRLEEGRWAEEVSSL